MPAKPKGARSAQRATTAQRVPSNSAPERFRLLSIDGGGIRGLIPALVLREIEARTRQPAHALFDAIAGTSTGGIIALGLAKGVPAAEIVDLYKDKASTIFGEGVIRHAVHSVLDQVKGPLSSVWPEQFPRLPHHFSPIDVIDPKYRAEGRRKVLHEVLGETPLSSARTRLFITSYETQTRMPVFFVRPGDESSGAYHQAVGDTTMLHAALATSAAPTYFAPHAAPRAEIPVDTKHEQLCFVDGGVYSNNPTGLAHSFLNAGQLGDQDAIVSLGTGGMTHPYPFDAIDGWGALHWAQPVIKMMFDGQSEAVALALSRRLPGANYLRLQAFLSDPKDYGSDILDAQIAVSDELDDTTTPNVEAMEKFAARLITRHTEQLDRMCQRLTR